MDVTDYELRVLAWEALRDDSAAGRMARRLRRQAREELDVPAFMRAGRQDRALHLCELARVQEERADEQAMRRGRWLSPEVGQA